MSYIQNGIYKENSLSVSSKHHQIIKTNLTYYDVFRLSKFIFNRDKN